MIVLYDIFPALLKNIFGGELMLIRFTECDMYVLISYKKTLSVITLIFEIKSDSTKEI